MEMTHAFQSSRILQPMSSHQTILGDLMSRRISKRCLKLKHVQMKGNKRESFDAKMFKDFIVGQKSNGLVYMLL
ncbi:hypothetical protein LXL04_035941 [Taraxacum kok-saghyz]